MRILRIGAREVATAEIDSIAVENVISRDSHGLRVMAVVFGTTSLVFLVGVTQFGWLPRFLIGGVFLLALALASVSDILGLRSIAYTRLHIRTRRGATLLFASADPVQVTALAAALGLVLPAGPPDVGRHKNGATAAPNVE